MTTEHGDANWSELIARADKEYRPIRSFLDWVDKVTLDPGRWDELRERMTRLRDEGDSELFARAKSIVSRIAAVETGAIENLYEVEQGFTLNVALTAEVTAQAVLEKLGQPKRDLIASQLAAYDFVMDFVTGQTPLAPAWIRQLHEQMCQAQSTYSAWNGLEWVELPLPTGQYKKSPNHVLLEDGSVHSYAPVEATQPEMQKLFDELGSEECTSAHPVLQAAYAHHCLTHIHPFTDGNGRVARALASVFTYRAAWVPALIVADEKAAYLAALREADAGRTGEFANFVRRGAEKAMELFLGGVKAARGPSMEDLSAAIDALFVTPGGFTHEQIDRAARSLLTAATAAFTEEFATLPERPLQRGVSVVGERYKQPIREGYRPPVGNSESSLHVSLGTPAPAGATIARRLRLEIPRESGRASLIYLHDPRGGSEFALPAGEIVPVLSQLARMRIRLFAHETVKAMLAELVLEARNSLTKSGY